MAVLTTAVPPVAGWHDTGVPKAITANDVQRLLDSCDISDPAGVRDYAILMLVARLGLRSIEVARLQLDDVDWRAGRIVLRGKASREDERPVRRCPRLPAAAQQSWQRTGRTFL